VFKALLQVALSRTLQNEIFWVIGYPSLGDMLVVYDHLNQLVCDVDKLVLHARLLSGEKVETLLDSDALLGELIVRRETS